MRVMRTLTPAVSPCTLTRYLMAFYPAGTDVYTCCYCIALPCGVIAFAKNLISVVHLYSAFYNIAVYDVNTDPTAKVSKYSAFRTLEGDGECARERESVCVCVCVCVCEVSGVFCGL
jgi:hypothetical protein